MQSQRRSRSGLEFLIEIPSLSGARCNLSLGEPPAPGFCLCYWCRISDLLLDWAILLKATLWSCGVFSVCCCFFISVFLLLNHDWKASSSVAERGTAGLMKQVFFCCWASVSHANLQSHTEVILSHGGHFVSCLSTGESQRTGWSMSWVSSALKLKGKSWTIMSMPSAHPGGNNL